MAQESTDSSLAIPAKLSNLWIQATVFGALWGGLEVTLGTLLHALRVPFSGVWMAGVGAVILIAGHTLYPRRGLALRVGAVCMLLKLISPGVIIVIPMLGIAMESLIVDLLAGRRPMRYPAGVFIGGLVTLSVIVQTLIAVMFIYGWDMMRLYVAMLERMIRWIGAGDEWGVWAIVLVVALTFSIGAVFGAYGVYLGRRVLRLREEADRV